MCDHTAWGVDVVQGVDSPRVKLLYDIYHMQIMEGDVIRTIRDNIQHIGHFHTGGVPGPARDRRHAGTALAHGREGDRRPQFRGLLRARVRADAGPDDVAQAGVRALHGVAKAGQQAR